jgi:hypothetical protein
MGERLLHSALYLSTSAVATGVPLLSENLPIEEDGGVGITS